MRPTPRMGRPGTREMVSFFSFFFMLGPKDHEALELAPGAVGSRQTRH